THCRFCKHDLLSPESKSKRAFFGPQIKLANARRWLPKLDELVNSLPDSDFKSHLIRGMTMKGRFGGMSPIGAEPNFESSVNDSNLGLERPPFEQDRALLWDVLVQCLDAKLDVSPILDTAKMRVLEITEEKVAEELRIRKQEENGRRCPFCAEFNLQSATTCRHCDSNFIDPPRREHRRLKRGILGLFPLDEKLLHDVILSIAATQSLADSAWRERLSEPLARNGITDHEVEDAAQRIQYLMSEDMEIPLPRSEWQRKLLKEGLDDGMDGYHSVHNMIELGQSCIAEERYQEAELVLNYAMAVADNCRLGKVTGLEAMREPLKTSGYLALSQLYEVTGRFAEAEKAHMKMFQTRVPIPIPGLEEILKATMDFLSPQRSTRQADLCLKQGKYDEAIELYKTALEHLDKQESRPFPALANLEGILKGEEPKDQYGKSDELAFDNAAKIGEVSDLVHVSTAQRVGLLKKLGDVYMMQKNLDEAEQVIEQAAELAEQLSNTYQALVADVSCLYAELHCARHRYAEAEPLFQRALNYYSSVRDPFDPGEFARILSRTHENYSVCLDKLNKDEEAEVHRRVAQELRKAHKL
ncbi:MAG TPA: tetratricopeptide repeat protein, partial [Candidatus Obscuribacterales bacterium]